MSVPPAPVAAGAHDDLTDVAGVRVGHYDRREGGWRTGTTVVLLPEGTIGGVDVRGGGPCTRETDALAPGTLVEQVHAICLSGGSVFGLAAAGGVTDWLAEQGRGLPVGPGPGEVAPIVPAACLYDLRPGAWDRRPDAAFGRAAAEAAAGAGGAGPVALGSVGAGTGARAGGLVGGVGSASTVLGGGVTVAALAAVNAAGDPVDPAGGRLLGSDLLLPGEGAGEGADGAAGTAGGEARRPDGVGTGAAGSERAGGEARPGPGGAARPAPGVEERPARGSTILVVVATDAELAQAECTRVAMAAHDGLARAVRPAHGLTDGDVVFAVATGAVPLDAGGGRRGLLRAGPARAAGLGAVMAAAADAVTRSIVRGLLAAQGDAFLPSYLDRHPGRTPPS